jgi:membrane-associated phospholipid phosphatase
MSSENFAVKRFRQRCFAHQLIFHRGTTQILLILLIVVPNWMWTPMTSQTEADPGGVECLDSLAGHLCRDTKHVLASALRWKQDDLVLLATLSVSTLAVMITDGDFQESVQENRTPTTDGVSEWTDRYAKRITSLTIGGLYLSGLVFGDRESKKTALLCLESVVLAEGITKGLKHVIGRSRPYGDRGAFSYDPLRFPPPSYSLSFPSGHATSAFALGTVIAEQYRNWLVRLICCGYAVVVSLARVNNNAHFLSDVLWGGIIGISVGKCLVRFHRGGKTADWQLTPRKGPDSTGFGVSIWLR